jgi:lycopene beta-cyclase
MRVVPEVEYALVGGGLQNALIAMALSVREPRPSIALVERGERLGGNHTWSFHAGDLPAGAARWIDPLVAHRWAGHEVLFPTLRRRIETPYAAVTSERLDQVVRAALGDGALLVGRAATSVEPHRVVLDDGTELAAGVVIDARGPGPGVDGGCGYQKFVGLELALVRPHGLAVPMLMDATVAQIDGFRFVYVLPLAPDRLLVEDTYFSDGAALDRAALRQRALAYARSRGFAGAEVVREEEGVLPMPWRGDGLPRPSASPLQAGYQGGWFHPATGYSFPVAARLAAMVAAVDGARLFGPELTALAASVRRQAAFARQLNRLLFRWCAPAERWQILERFYRLPEDLIQRFYALDMAPSDMARILIGRPPRGLSLRARLRKGGA